MDRELSAALADDLDQLIRLHDREIDGETLAALRDADFPNGLALLPQCDNWLALAAALREPATLDDLAADFAAIYLNNTYATSPYESVWLSDDHLACAAPLFELRELYAKAGLKAADWRQRFDDHFVLQLQYLRHRLSAPDSDAGELGNFIDEHIGYWFPDFAQRVAGHCDTPFYAALALLTQAWLGELRDLLARLSGSPVPTRATMTERINRKLALDKADVVPIRFMPGAQGPSW